MSSWRRFGGFLIAIGVFLLVLFVLSDSVLQPVLGLLLGGIGCLALGIFLVVTNPAPEPPPRPRFRMIKRHKDEPRPKNQQKEKAAKQESRQARR